VNLGLVAALAAGIAVTVASVLVVVLLNRMSVGGQYLLGAYVKTPVFAMYIVPFAAFGGLFSGSIASGGGVIL